MNNFTYCNPVKIVFGKDSIAQLAQLLNPDEKIMMIYGGGSIKKNGVYDQAVNALKDMNVIEFSGIEPNPTYETCMKAVEIAKAEKVDFLLAVGGGSVLDAVKFIAAAIKFQGPDPWQIMVSHGDILESAMPLGTILTLPATGSEMNFYSVISRTSTKEKLAFGNPLVYPKFSVLDPQTTYTLSKKQLRNGIVDTFVHVIEQYITYDVNTPLQDRQAQALIKTIVELADDILSQKNDYDTMANFMWCATQALNGTISCGAVEDWSTHMIGHELTAFFGIDHAESLAVVLPGLWEIQFESKKYKLAQMAEQIWNVNDGSIDEKAKAAIAKTVEFFHSVDMPTKLSDYNITSDGIQLVVDRFAKRATVLGEKQDIDAKRTKQILDRCL